MAPSRMVSLNSDIFKCCHKVETLGWDNDTEAKSLLQRAANQVKPIMAKRQWAVPILAEFYPRARNLLGLNHNHGEKIEIRLRSPSNRSSFLQYESILGTLLHELVHIEVGPHNAAFYKLLDVLNKECDQLIATDNDGNTSSDFVGQGRKAGDWASRNAPRHQAGNRAVSAALKRQRVGAIMFNGGQRLGGSADIARLCDPREMALAAAERRLADETWCGSARENNDVVVDLDQIPDEVIVISDDEVSEVLSAAPAIPSPPIARPTRTRNQNGRSSVQHVPTRQRPAALAALRRAGNG